MLTVLRALIALSALIVCLPAAAQKNEIALAFGLRGGGELEIRNSPQSPDLEIAPSFGLIYNRALGPDTAFTTFWSHQATEISVPGAFANSDEFELDIDYLQAGTVYRPDRDGAAEGFVQITAGLTWYRPGPSGFADEYAFSLTAGGGGQFRLSRRFAFRVEARMLFTLTRVSFAGVCASGACTFFVGSSGAFQFEGLGALVYRF